MPPIAPPRNMQSGLTTLTTPPDPQLPIELGLASDYDQPVRCQACAKTGWEMCQQKMSIPGHHCPSRRPRPARYLRAASDDWKPCRLLDHLPAVHEPR